MIKAYNQSFMKDLQLVNQLKCKVRVLSSSLKAPQSVLQYHDSPSDVDYSAFLSVYSVFVNNRVRQTIEPQCMNQMQNSKTSKRIC
jgi:hypothetical protein